MKFILTALFSLGLLVMLFSGSGCGNVLAPDGGPRDTLPPVLLSAEPRDSSVNFRGNKIVFKFDENLADLYETQANLLFTPIFEKTPVVTLKGETMTVNFKSPLEPNTTYILNFGDAIRDNNEGNILKGFVYTFSTGPYLDSLQIKGRGVLAETGQVDTTLIALLYSDLKDSAVRTHRPSYVSRLDRNGNFLFKNLPKDTFAVYLLGNAGITRQYQNPSQLFAFANNPVIAGSSDSLVLYAYKETESTNQQNTTAFPGGLPKPAGSNDRRLRISPKFPGLQDLQKDYQLQFPVPLRTFDSTKLSLSVDSSFTPVRYSVSLDSTKRELSLKSAWKEDSRYNIILDKEFASDSGGRQLLKTDTLFFSTRKLSDYGSVQINIKNVDTSQHPVLLFIQNNQIVETADVGSGVYRKQFVLPGEFELRVLYDRNRNGKYDPGNFFKGRRQPERIITLSQKLTVKANMDNVLDLPL